MNPARHLFLVTLLLSARALADVSLPEIEDVDLLAIDKPLKTLLDQRLSGIRTKKEKTTALHALLFSSYEQNIIYDFSTTLTAQETYEQKRGNCLSQAALFVAAARYLGLKAEFQSVKTYANWERQEGFYLVPEHLNASVKLPGRRRATIEFLSPEIHERAKTKTRKVSDLQVLADYYNNKGVEALSLSDTRLALAYFLKSVNTRSRSAYAWSNVGTAYKLLGEYEQAEAAFLKAYRLDKRDKSIVLNLYAFYRERGEEDKARHYFSRLEKYQKALNKHLPEDK